MKIWCYCCVRYCIARNGTRLVSVKVARCWRYCFELELLLRITEIVYVWCWHCCCLHKGLDLGYYVSSKVDKGRLKTVVNGKNVMAADGVVGEVYEVDHWLLSMVWRKAERTVWKRSRRWRRKHVLWWREEGVCGVEKWEMWLLCDCTKWWTREGALVEEERYFYSSFFFT